MRSKAPDRRFTVKFILQGSSVYMQLKVVEIKGVSYWNSPCMPLEQDKIFGKTDSSLLSFYLDKSR